MKLVVSLSPSTALVEVDGQGPPSGGASRPGHDLPEFEPADFDLMLALGAPVRLDRLDLLEILLYEERQVT